MPASKTHNELLLRPPPGVRFSIWGSDVALEFQRGREREVVAWLRAWIDAFLEPEVLKAEALAEAGKAKIRAKTEPEILKTEATWKAGVEAVKVNPGIETETEEIEGEDHGKHEE